MVIQFHCEHCRKEIQAPDEAGGKRGKCPYCDGSNFIPRPASDDDDIRDIAPIDEAEEEARKREIERLLQAEREILAETSREEAEPRLAEREPEQVVPADVQHLVVNFCLDMANGQLERADVHVMKLSKHTQAAKQAVREFLDGTAIEPALDSIPTKVRDGYLKNLMMRLR